MTKEEGREKIADETSAYCLPATHLPAILYSLPLDCFLTLTVILTLSSFSLEMSFCIVSGDQYVHVVRF